MVKPKVSAESKDKRFKRIASQRTQRTLNDIRKLGNCSNKGIYSYTSEDISKIFSAIDKEIRRFYNIVNVTDNVINTYKAKIVVLLCDYQTYPIILDE